MSFFGVTVNFITQNLKTLSSSQFDLVTGFSEGTIETSFHIFRTLVPVACFGQFTGHLGRAASAVVHLNSAKNSQEEIKCTKAKSYCR